MEKIKLPEYKFSTGASLAMGLEIPERDFWQKLPNFDVDSSSQKDVPNWKISSKTSSGKYTIVAKRRDYGSRPSYHIFIFEKDSAGNPDSATFNSLREAYTVHQRVLRYFESEK